MVVLTCFLQLVSCLLEHCRLHDVTNPSPNSTQSIMGDFEIHCQIHVSVEI